VITLSVKSFNGAPTDGPSVAFDELGGTIGRADSNQLVLPDPERTISRVHAQVVFRNNAYAIIDRGSNPIAINGRPLGSGVEAPIKPGDDVQIGGYLLRVSAARAPSASADPFGDLLAPPGAPGGTANSPPDPLGAFAAAPPSRRSGAPATDPFAAFGASAHGDLPATPAAGGIPADWNPFAPDAPAPATHDLARSLGRGGGGFGLDATPAAPAPLVPDLPGRGSAGAQSIDSLFGLKPNGGGDPLAHSLLDAAVTAPNTAASTDPLQSLTAAPRATAPTAGDDFSDLNRPFTPPTPMSKAAATGMPPEAEAPAAAAPGVPRGAVLSWDGGGGEARTVIHPRSTTGAAAPPSTAARTVPTGESVRAPDESVDPLAAFGMAPAATASPAAPAAAPAVSARAGAASADVQALLAAFREGLATPSAPVEALTPEFMRLIGELLRESAAGTVDLLIARAALKREIRADSTMIVARENNPLKFSPSAEAALFHLLAPPTRGFMAAGPAMRDAYQDLRAHQFGFVAGLRAALEGVLERFDPALLEGRLTQPSALQALLPGSRKARLWELFNELYAQIRSEAADDFHALFGKAFLKAYEEHIDQLPGDRP
jgi:FHA domain-containing protein